MMQKARRENIPPTPRSLQEWSQMLEEYEPLRAFYRGAANGRDGSVALVFMHEKMLVPLSTCTQLFCDGTFKVR